ncbi:reverse transcriptase domain-containing protein, partial [Pantoea dispersa]
MKIIARILNRRLEHKIEGVMGEDQFGFRKGKGTRDAIGMVRILSERVLAVNEEVCACFIDWQKAFDRVNWTKLMNILKEIGVNWRDRRLILNLYLGQRVKVR